MNLFHKKIIKKLSVSIFPTISVLALCACTDSELKENTENNPFPIRVSALLSETVFTRDYMESGEVTDGKYYLSYPEVSTSNYALATVDFDRSVTPGLGIVTMPDNREMIWENVGGGPVVTFYLDNVVPTDENPENPMIVNFTDGGPYKAALFDDKDGTNDLLWGSIQVSRETTRTLNFSLHHNMARLKVEVTVDKTFEIDGNLDLEDAIVEISSINQKPLSFDRLTGLLALETEDPEAYTTLTLVNPEVGLNWASGPDISDSPGDDDDNVGEGENENEGDKSDNDEGDSDNNLLVYITPDFVLPPQDLRTDENRPRLTITLTLANGSRTFSGIIPYAMNVVDSDHPTEYPVTLSFLKEHVLTLHTLISNDPPTLSFMPVTVVEWVDKGTFDIDGHQAGIYFASEFYSLIEYYTSNNEYQLQRYGNLEGSTWQFNIWSPLTLEYNKIWRMMVPSLSDNYEYTFKYNGYQVEVKNNGVVKPVEVAQLIKILSGTLTFDQI